MATPKSQQKMQVVIWKDEEVEKEGKRMSARRAFRNCIMMWPNWQKQWQSIERKGQWRSLISLRILLLRCGPRVHFWIPRSTGSPPMQPQILKVHKMENLYTYVIVQLRPLQVLSV
ncbi:unnamed protein product [Calypogeia fissa]